MKTVTYQMCPLQMTQVRIPAATSLKLLDVQRNLWYFLSLSGGFTIAIIIGSILGSTVCMLMIVALPFYIILRVKGHSNVVTVMNDPSAAPINNGYQPAAAATAPLPPQNYYSCPQNDAIWVAVVIVYYLWLIFYFS